MTWYPINHADEQPNLVWLFPTKSERNSVDSHLKTT